MKGSFDICCERRLDGVTGITTQRVSAPWHLSKPYWDGEVLLVQAVNATAGIFAGDTLSFSVNVALGASVLLTSPSASRIHTMPEGEATLAQRIRVEDGAWLEWMPELFIPQRQCRYRQSTMIDLAADARLFMVETLAPGRVAHGEVFAFDRVTWKTRLSVGGELVLAETYPMTPSDHSLRDLGRFGQPRYFASAILVDSGFNGLRPLQENLAHWNTEIDGHFGATRIHRGVVLIRMLVADSITLKRTLARLRDYLSSDLPPLRRSPRKQ